MLAYDDPRYTLLRETRLTAAAGAAAVSAKFAQYAAVVLSRARAVVKTAGTSADTGSFVKVMVNGTTTAGVLLTGSATAGTVVDVSLGNTVVPAGQTVHCVNGTDATGAAEVSIEYTHQVV